MNEFIMISERTIGAKEVYTVDARELHKFLGSKSKFANWIEYRTKRSLFTEGTDFIIKKNYRYSPPLKKYHLNIAMTQWICAKERGIKKFQFVRYFSEHEGQRLARDRTMLEEQRLDQIEQKKIRTRNTAYKIRKLAQLIKPFCASIGSTGL
jgi:phage anti-repressor protein